MKNHLRPALALPLLLALPAGLAGPRPDRSAAGDRPQKLTANTHHIGNSDKPEWKDFTTVKPEHPSYLKLTFHAERELEPTTLEIRAGGVGAVWKVKVNHREIGDLKKGEAAQEQFLEIPEGLLKKTHNELLIETATADDDIFIGPITLHHARLEELLRMGEVKVSVVDQKSGQGLPCRLTVTRLATVKVKGQKEEELSDIKGKETPSLAIRRGIVYTLTGEAGFKLKPGRYRIYATRGFEYGVASQVLELPPSGKASLKLKLEREVDTTGYLAADTHIHTRTYSGHGDATMEERMVTIAGEGVEVAIATDHNHHTDYRPQAEKVGAQDQFYSIIGNEFTTPIAHFNGFPMEKGARPAFYSSHNWTRLVASLRATPGVKVIICNHPRRAKSDEQAFNNIQLNPLSGEVHHGPASLGIDAVEVLNARGLLDDRLLTFRDWFGLLNRGFRLAAVAGSDSHTVEGIVGQCRTYIQSQAEDPAQVEMGEITESFLKGRLLVCVGLLTQVKVDGRFGVGDLATGLGEKLAVEITVSGPRWTAADLVTLYLNGQPVKEERIHHSKEAVVKYHATWQIPTPPHDVHLVVIASGPPITAPFWALSQSQDKKYVLGATNPVWIDGDGDGTFTSAFGYASRLVKEHGGEPARFHQLLAGYDVPVALQTASILRQEVQGELQAEYERLLEKESRRLEVLLSTDSDPVNRRFQDYLKNTPPIEVLTRRERLEEERQAKIDQEREEKARIEAEKKAKDKKNLAGDGKKKRY
jgi:hypothetical protein